MTYKRGRSSHRPKDEKRKLATSPVLEKKKSSFFDEQTPLILREFEHLHRIVNAVQNQMVCGAKART